MRGHLRRTFAALIVMGACAPAGAAQAQVAATPCTGEDLEGAQCRTVSVPLDHANPAGEKLSLRVATFPAKGTRKGTVVFVPGGPGQAAIPSAAGFLETAGPALEGYDVVFADPRGTGASSPLTCAALPGGRVPAEIDDDAQLRRAVTACGQELGGRRAHFTTYASVLDLDLVRSAVGADKIIPLGVSYGGQVAGDYARRFPERVQAVVLDSASPVEASDALAKLPTLAIPRVLRETCFPPGCRQIFGDPNALLADLVAALREKPLRGNAILPTGRKRAATVTASDVYSLVRSSDADPALRTALPAAIAAGAEGDAAPLLRLMQTVRGGGTTVSDINEIRFLATECVEGRLPWAPDSDPASREALLEQAYTAAPEAWAPFGPEAIAGSSAPLCAGWPSTTRPPYPPNATQGPNVPVLVLAGRDDLRTPLEDQRRTAAQYPNAQVVAVPNAGHSVLGADATGCAVEALGAFLAGGPKPACKNEQLLALAPPAFSSLRQVPTLSGDLPVVVERTAVAIDVTMRDISRQMLTLISGGSTNASVTKRKLRIGGLRGGRLIVDADRLRLLNYEVVPGVRVTGSARLAEDALGALRLTVTGSGATGTATIPPKGSTFRATLDGRTLTYRARQILG